SVAASRPTWRSICRIRFNCSSSADKFWSGLFANAKKCFERASAQGFPDFDHFISNNGGKAHSQPNTNRFNGQAEPRSDVQSHQNTRVVFPPTIGQRKRHFPKQTKQKKQKEREAEGPPIDEALRGMKEASRRNERSAHKINKVPGETFGRAGQKLSIRNRGGDQ